MRLTAARRTVDSKPWLRNYGHMTALSDVEVDKISELVRNRWEWSQMGVVVVGSYEGVVRAVRDLGVSGNDSLGVLGWIVSQGAGGSIRPASRTTETKYRKLAREAGVCLGVGEMASRRLDFDRGTVVTGTDPPAQRMPT